MAHCWSLEPNRLPGHDVLFQSLSALCNPKAPWSLTEAAPTTSRRASIYRSICVAPPSRLWLMTLAPIFVSFLGRLVGDHGSDTLGHRQHPHEAFKVVGQHVELKATAFTTKNRHDSRVRLISLFLRRPDCFAHAGGPEDVLKGDGHSRLFDRSPATRSPA
jgi:hypothetical protein